MPLPGESRVSGTVAVPRVPAGIVYAHPEYITSLDTSTPISAHVEVDFELHGCPIDRHQLLEVLIASLVGRRPVIPGHSVCQECKARGTVCVLVSKNTACLGPVTRTGCGALCPSVGRGCFGCFGPADTANTASLADRLKGDGLGERRSHVSSGLSMRAHRPFSKSPLLKGPRCPSPSVPPGRPLWIRGDHEPRIRLLSRSIGVEGLARVEGEGSLRVEVRDGEVTEVALEIFEPPRYFEALLVGRHFTEAPI